MVFAILSTLLLYRVLHGSMRLTEGQVVSDLLVVGLFLLRFLFQALWRGITKKRHILSPEELEDRQNKRKEVATMRKSLLEEKKRGKKRS
jgi:hypothetical protein